MKRDLFRRYVWLVDVIRHAKSITYEEISELWKESPLNTDQSPLALRTFHNHRDAIAQLFGIRIHCNRSDHEYYIQQDGIQGSETKLRVWMLQSLSLSALPAPEETIDSRVILDINPEEKHGLAAVFEAMDNGNAVAIRYPEIDGDSVRRSDAVIEPYCIRFWHYGWYLLGRNTETGKLEIYPLSDVLQISILDKKFTYPSDFIPRDFFRKYFGVEIDSDLEPLSIRVRIKGEFRQRLRIHPLHASQREVLTEPDSSIFDYLLVPSLTFISYILSLGPKAEIIAPASLRAEMLSTIKKMLSLYE